MAVAAAYGRKDSSDAVVGDKFHTGKLRLLPSFISIIFCWYALYQVHYSPFECTRAVCHLCL